MNKRIIGWLGIAAGLALGSGCFRNTTSEIELDIPAMQSPGCAQLVQSAVGRLGEGTIRDIRVDVEQQKAWVTYDNVRLGRRNIEVAIRNAGFAVNDLPANEEARMKLPAECRGDE